VSVVHALSQLSAGEAGNDCETLQSNSPVSRQTSKSGTQFLSSNTAHSSAVQGVDYSSQIAARFRCHAVSIVRFLVGISQNAHAISYECRHSSLK